MSRFCKCLLIAIGCFITTGFSDNVPDILNNEVATTKDEFYSTISLYPSSTLSASISSEISTYHQTSTQQEYSTLPPSYSTWSASTESDVTISTKVYTHSLSLSPISFSFLSQSNSQISTSHSKQTSPFISFSTRQTILPSSTSIAYSSQILPTVSWTMSTTSSEFSMSSVSGFSQITTHSTEKQTTALKVTLDDSDDVLVLGLSIGLSVLVLIIVCVLVLVMFRFKSRSKKQQTKPEKKRCQTPHSSNASADEVHSSVNKEQRYMTERKKINLSTIIPEVATAVEVNNKEPSESTVAVVSKEEVTNSEPSENTAVTMNEEDPNEEPGEIRPIQIKEQCQNSKPRDRPAVQKKEYLKKEPRERPAVPSDFVEFKRAKKEERKKRLEEGFSQKKELYIKSGTSNAK